MHPFTVLFCITLLASSSYTIGRMQGGWGWRRGYRRGYRDGNQDGTWTAHPGYRRGYRDGNQDGQSKSVRDAVTLARSVADVHHDRAHLHPSLRNAGRNRAPSAPSAPPVASHTYG